MKTLLVILALAAVIVAGAYVYGVVTLSESGANRFLDELESLSLREGAPGYCGRVHPDARVTISDHSAVPAADFSGGREQLCAYVEYASKGIGILGLSTHATRNDFAIERDWLHPWTVRVTYHEDRVTTMSKVNATLHTRSDDTLTLVQTPGGIRLLELDSRVSRAP